MASTKRPEPKIAQPKGDLRVTRGGAKKSSAKKAPGKKTAGKKTAAKKT